MRGSRFTAGAFRFFEGTTVQHSRHKRRGQMIPRGQGKWLLRVFLGRDPQGRKKYASKTVVGTTAQTQQELTKLLREADTSSLVRPTRQMLADYVEQWYKTKLQVSESTLNGYRLQLGLYILRH